MDISTPRPNHQLHHPALIRINPLHPLRMMALPRTVTWTQYLKCERQTHRGRFSPLMKAISTFPKPHTPKSAPAGKDLPASSKKSENNGDLLSTFYAPWPFVDGSFCDPRFFSSFHSLQLRYGLPPPSNHTIIFCAWPSTSLCKAQHPSPHHRRRSWAHLSRMRNQPPPLPLSKTSRPPFYIPKKFHPSLLLSRKSINYRRRRHLVISLR